MENKPKTETDKKIFEAVIKVAAEEAWQEEMKSLPSLEELNEIYPASESVDKRVYGIINTAARRGKIKKTIQTTARLVAGICVLMVLAGGVLLSVEASRTFILSRIISMGEDYVQIHFHLGYAADLQVGELVINYIPADFAFYAQGELAEGYVYYLFRSDTRRVIMISHLVASDDSCSIFMYNPMTEYCEFTTISLNGQTAYLFVVPSHNTISWNYGRHFISISAWIDVEELIEIAEMITIE